MKGEVDKLKINQLINIQTVSDDLKIKVDNSDARNFLIDFQTLSGVVSRGVAEKVVRNKLNINS